MRAIVLREHGGVEALRLEEHPEPSPGPGEALVRVHATAVNRLDVLVREGAGHTYESRLPLVPGYDVAGEVLAVGSPSDARHVGKRAYVHYDYSCGHCAFCLDGDESLCAAYSIMGVDHDGGYAELVLASVRNLFALDDRVSYDSAAAAGSVSLTAHHMLFARGKARAGETVLVMAAGSGVGGAALQLAAWAGARTIATAGGAEKCERARAGGAKHVVDYSRPGWEQEVRALTGGRGVDCVVDHTGSAHFQQMLATLAPRGRVVVCGASSGAAVSVDLIDLFARQISLIGSSDGTRRELLQVLELVAEGTLTPVVDTVLPLCEVATAQVRLERREHYGRILLRPTAT